MTLLQLTSRSLGFAAAFIASSKPTWIWAADQEKLVWSNRAARAFEASRGRTADDRLVPVARQVIRTVRLGVPFSPSPARLQFTLGRKPVSASCLCTPLVLEGGFAGLMATMSDPVPADELKAVDFVHADIAPFVGSAPHTALVDADGLVVYAEGEGSERSANGQTAEAEFAAGQSGARLLIFAATAAAQSDTNLASSFVSEDDVAARVVEDEFVETEAPVEADAPVDRLSELLDRLDSRQVLYQPLDENDDGSFFDALPGEEQVAVAEPGEDENDADEVIETLPDEAVRLSSPGISVDAPAEPHGAREIAEVLADQAEAAANSLPEIKTVAEIETDKASIPAKLWRVIGRGLAKPTDHAASGTVDDAAGETETSKPRERKIDHSELETTARLIEALTAAHDERERDTESAAEKLTGLSSVEDEVGEPDASADVSSGTLDKRPAGVDAEVDERDVTSPENPDDDETLPPIDEADLDRASRYNFDELSRILTDRVSGDTVSRGGERSEVSPVSVAGSLVNLGDENLILNRLPIGLLVFRDQEILFANRALSDLLGYVDSSNLRKAGLAGVFPPEGDQETAGPVTKLVTADARTITVSARLQTISWQGRPALLLSASRKEEKLNVEDLSRNFAEVVANALDYGFFETSRTGVLTAFSPRAALLAGRKPDTLVGRPLQNLIAVNQLAKLRNFLEKPARFAGVERPVIRLNGVEPGSEVILFAEGMAGIISGYFGLLRVSKTASEAETATQRIDPNFLVRLGRAVRQPVNAIVGFAEMMRDQTHGPIGNARYLDYARFIQSAGQDIADVVDELEDYAQLSDANYRVESSAVDFAELLETCVYRVKSHAVSVNVLVRSSISSSLPNVIVDRDTIQQAVLNLLASAISHSPRGGQVVLSAHARSDGAVEVHVRDSGSSEPSELEDRFVIFREGVAADGESLSPTPSTIGLALTQSLLAVNGCTLETSFGRGSGILLTLVVPSEAVVSADSAQR